MDKYIIAPITEEVTANLKSGDFVYLSGTVYSARDAAHKRLAEAIEKGEDLPFDLKDSVVYYMGPSPAREGRPIGSAGPTTASRMDKYAPALLDLGQKAMIGKGKRSQEVIDAMIRNHAVYFAAIGGAGALLSKCITKSEVVCYEDLGDPQCRAVFHCQYSGVLFLCGSLGQVSGLPADRKRLSVCRCLLLKAVCNFAEPLESSVPPQAVWDPHRITLGISFHGLRLLQVYVEIVFLQVLVVQEALCHGVAVQVEITQGDEEPQNY